VTAASGSGACTVRFRRWITPGSGQTTYVIALPDADCDGAWCEYPPQLDPSLLVDLERAMKECLLGWKSGLVLASIWREQLCSIAERVR
jgi:hypothetical protein